MKRYRTTLLMASLAVAILALIVIAAPRAGLIGSDTALATGPNVDCGPGIDWVNECAEVPSEVLEDTGALLGISIDDDCIADVSFVVNGDVTISRDKESGGVIDTKINTMTLTGSGPTVRVGDAAIKPLKVSEGAIIQQTGDNTLADSFFNVYVEAGPG